jgi:hypothetical protein
MDTPMMKKGMERKNPLKPADLHVMLERAFRRESRNCVDCSFTLPHALAGAGGGDWSVIPSNSCSDACRMILEDVVTRYRQMYRLDGERS